MKFLRNLVVSALVLLAPAVSFALPPATLADLTGVIDFTSMAAAVLAVALVIINFKVVKQGALVVLHFIGFGK